MSIENQHPESKRWLVIENEGEHSLWAYLTHPETRNITSVAVVLSFIEPIDDERMQEYRSSGGPPPITKKYASGRGFFADELPEMGLSWSETGHAALILLDGEPWVLVSPGLKYGMSKSVALGGPFGLAWDDGVYEREFV
jgi:hypothetical protein